MNFPPYFSQVVVTQIEGDRYLTLSKFENCQTLIESGESGPVYLCIKYKYKILNKND